MTTAMIRARATAKSRDLCISIFCFLFFGLNLTVDREGLMFVVFLMSEAFMEMTFHTMGRTFTSGRGGLVTNYRIHITLCMHFYHYITCVLDNPSPKVICSSLGISLMSPMYRVISNVCAS
jgi:hypothetical protein